MAKKKSGKKPVRKSTRKATGQTKKKSASKSAGAASSRTRKKPAGKSKTSAKKTTTKTVAKKAARKKKSSARKSSRKSASKRKTLGRPRIPADARLELIFQKDYQAREIFQFLGISTVRELERFGPDEIIQKLTSPMVQTVGRIRKALAVANRSLADDTAFALEFRDQYMSES